MRHFLSLFWNITDLVQEKISWGFNSFQGVGRYDKIAVAAPLKAILPPLITGNAPNCLPWVP